ncbi:Apmap [Scenedesmus sp. PABB004]|nr:Apmap [Scenedesmus sp. PABB004]
MPSTLQPGAPALRRRRSSFGGAGSSKGLGPVLALALAGVVALISGGQLRVPLPAPAHGHYVHVVSEDVLPWRPAPLEGPFAPNTRLRDAVRLFEGRVLGAESVAVAPGGGLALLDRYGRLLEAARAPGGGGYDLAPRPRAALGGGRPLGYHFDAAGDLLVCDSNAGLVKYSYADNSTTVLADRVSASSPIDPGTPIVYANDLAVASDGRVYFTACTDIAPSLAPGGYRDTFRAWMLGLAQARGERGRGVQRRARGRTGRRSALLTPPPPSARPCRAQGLPRGRLLRYDPATGETAVLAKGFYYANGVALAADESYLVLAETDRIRLLKFWLTGPKAGTHEPLLERLPGPPDGVSAAPDGAFWVALVSPVPPIARLLRDPAVRAVYAWLPDWARPPLKKWGAVAKVDGGSGRVLDWLMDPDGTHVSTVSAALEHGGRLFLGNLAGDYVSYVDLPPGTAQAQQQEQQQYQEQQEQEQQYQEQQEQEQQQQEQQQQVQEQEQDEASEAERAARWVAGLVAARPLVVFSKTYCPYSLKAKDALASVLRPAGRLGALSVVELDQLGQPGGASGALAPADARGPLGAPALQDALGALTGARTVPRVFIGGRFVGGGDDTAALVASGRAAELLAQAGVLPAVAAAAEAS